MFVLFITVIRSEIGASRDHIYPRGPSWSIAISPTTKRFLSCRVLFILFIVKLFFRFEIRQLLSASFASLPIDGCNVFVARQLVRLGI
jgi:hypothetical protein